MPVARAPAHNSTCCSAACSLDLLAQHCYSRHSQGGSAPTVQTYGRGLVVKVSGTGSSTTRDPSAAVAVRGAGMLSAAKGTNSTQLQLAMPVQMQGCWQGTKIG